MRIKLCACMTAMAIAWTAMPHWARSQPPKPALDITGTVIDAETKQPIDRAYVLASYKVVRSGLATTKSFCVKTLGMYTGPDGKYQFPVERLDGVSPLSTNAIKPGYYLDRFDIPDLATWRRQGPDLYANRNIYLKKQDPAHPIFRFGDTEENCDEPANAAALAPAIKFIEMEIAEEKRLGAPKNGIERHEDLVRSLQHLPVDLRNRPLRDRITVTVSCSVDMSKDARPCCIEMAAADGFVPFRDRVRNSGLPFTVNDATREVCVRRQDKPRAIEIASEVAKSLHPSE